MGATVKGSVLISSVSDSGYDLMQNATLNGCECKNFRIGQRMITSIRQKQQKLMQHT